MGWAACDTFTGCRRCRAGTVCHSRCGMGGGGQKPSWAHVICAGQAAVGPAPIMIVGTAPPALSFEAAGVMQGSIQGCRCCPCPALLTLLPRPSVHSAKPCCAELPCAALCCAVLHCAVLQACTTRQAASRRACALRASRRSTPFASATACPTPIWASCWWQPVRRRWGGLGCAEMG